jgi:transposase
VASIAEYLAVSKQTVYTTLKRWVQEGVKGLDDKSHARKAPRVVTLEIANEIRKKQENPLIGEWRMHAALLQEGIKASPRTCGRIMAKNRALYGWDKPKGPAKPKKEMPFKASRRHEYWSIDIPYIEHHQLPNVKGPVYVISILENFSRMLLASAISERQDTAAYLRVLASALHNYGAPEARVTDSGGVFYSKRAMAIYEALDIRKERIDPRQSWQNYIEAHFGIMRRLADYYLNKAPTLDEMKKAHRKFIRDYNTQIHFAHRERQDNRHSPQDVLRGVLARTLPAPTLARIFFATEFTRHLDRSGYIRFRRWRFYAEEGLARQQVQVRFYTSTLKIEYQDTELAFYTLEWEDNKHIKEVKNPRLIETGYRSPQLTLWTLGPDEWLLFLKLPDYAARKKPQKKSDVLQLSLAFPT